MPEKAAGKKEITQVGGREVIVLRSAVTAEKGGGGAFSVAGILEVWVCGVLGEDGRGWERIVVWMMG